MIDVSHLSSAARLAARREVAALKRLLRPGEPVVDLCHGRHESGTGLLVATDRRVILIHTGRLWGTHAESIPWPRVRLVEDQMGVRSAVVTVAGGGRTFELRDVDGGLADTFCTRLRARLTPEA